MSDSTPAVVGTVAFLVSILLHEFGHALTARRFGVDTESIQLWALGGVARLSANLDTQGRRLDRRRRTAHQRGDRGRQPVGAWWALGGTPATPDFVAMLAWLGFINATLALFNLLPGAPLDGGRILKACAGRSTATATARRARPAAPAACSDGRWPASDWC